MEGELVIKSKLNGGHQYTLKSLFYILPSYARFSISIISKSLFYRLQSQSAAWCELETTFSASARVHM
jgi:hypothetical protein